MNEQKTWFEMSDRIASLIHYDATWQRYLERCRHEAILFSAQSLVNTLDAGQYQEGGPNWLEIEALLGSRRYFDLTGTCYIDEDTFDFGPGFFEITLMWGAKNSFRYEPEDAQTYSMEFPHDDWVGTTIDDALNELVSDGQISDFPEYSTEDRFTLPSAFGQSTGASTYYLVTTEFAQILRTFGETVVSFGGIPIWRRWACNQAPMLDPEFTKMFLRLSRFAKSRTYLELIGCIHRESGTSVPMEVYDFLEGCYVLESLCVNGRLRAFAFGHPSGGLSHYEVSEEAMGVQLCHSLQEISAESYNSVLKRQPAAVVYHSQSAPSGKL